MVGLSYYHFTGLGGGEGGGGAGQRVTIPGVTNYHLSLVRGACLSTSAGLSNDISQDLMCRLECAGSRERERPVCGSDGITYKSR